ncbi:tetratricopeptide repeat protein [Actinosynnema sp. NPDC050436]|uniref:ATP-binding protein n=1 Tax=Actinosynnema sp. NPDC050436 TaxID=3155659 RepID=UPI0033CAFC66
MPRRIGPVIAPRAGARLRELRRERGISLAALSRLSFYSKGYLSKVENGEKPCTAGIARSCDRLLDTGGELQSLVQHQERDSLPERSAVEPASGFVIPAELPHDVVGFSGRQAELASLHALPPPGGGVAVSVVGGAAGIGKTALVVHWAHQVRGRFPDGQLFLDLRGFDPHRPPLAPADALAQLLRSLGLEPQDIPTDQHEQARKYRSLLADRAVLVVLDDAASPEQVRPLLPGGRRCFTVVTSRNRLVGLIAHDGAHPVALDALTPDEARGVLAGALGERRVAEEPAAARLLARLCGGLPLALRMAAAQLALGPHRRIADLVAELSGADRLAALAGGEESAGPGAAFALSYRALPLDTRRLFRLLGLAPGPDFTAEAAAALADVPGADAAGSLDALAAAHLVETTGPGRFRFHDLVRDFARERCELEDDRAERDAAVRRLLVRYLYTARAASGPPWYLELPHGEVCPVGEPAAFPDDADALAWLERERANLAAAQDHAARHGPRELSWHLADALVRYSWMRLPRGSWHSSAHLVLDAAVAGGDLRGQALVHCRLGTALWDAGQAEQAVEHYRRALAVSTRIGWSTGRAWANAGLGVVGWASGRLGSALEHDTAALELFRATGDREAEAFILGMVGRVHRDLGRLRDASDHLELSLRLNPRTGWRRETLSLPRQVLALVRWELGRPDAGLAVLEDVLADPSGPRDGQAIALDAVARIKTDLGRPAEALEDGERARRLLRDTRRHATRAGIMTTLATAHRELGDFRRATAAHRRALGLADEAGHRRAQAEGHLGLATTRRLTGRPEDGRAHALHALRLARLSSLRVVEGQALTELAHLHAALGDHPTALAHARTALALHRTTGHRPGETRALAALDESRRALGDVLTPDPSGT